VRCYVGSDVIVGESYITSAVKAVTILCYVNLLCLLILVIIIIIYLFISVD